MALVAGLYIYKREAARNIPPQSRISKSQGIE